MGVAWKKEFSICVSEIDQQHQEIFALLDRFLEAIERGDGAAKVAETLGYLDDYTRRHFVAEEELQQRFSYPHAAMHAAEHRNFLNELARLKERLEKGGPTDGLVRLTREVLAQWLTHHICELDKVMGEYVNKHRNEEWEAWLKSRF